MKNAACLEWTAAYYLVIGSRERRPALTWQLFDEEQPWIWN
jgi:hypothetical protein